MHTCYILQIIYEFHLFPLYQIFQFIIFYSFYFIFLTIDPNISFYIGIKINKKLKKIKETYYYDNWFAEISYLITKFLSTF
jgi:hypothetical protein